MIRIALCGAAGRMGQEIIKAAEKHADISIRVGVEACGNAAIGKTVGNMLFTDALAPVIKDCECVLDFTNHEAAMAHMGIASQHGIPFVTGTTGFSEDEQESIKRLSEKIPIFQAPNMSVGVNHLYHLVEATATALQDFNIEIVETHHKAKKDAPSGTAKAIAKIIESIRKGSRFIYGRKGMVGERSHDEVCINSVRGGDVVGEHRVLFLGSGEFVELRHYATSRQCFAAGALLAVRFIIDKPPGLYDMNNLLHGLP